MQQHFAILRVAKMRGAGQVAASAAHLSRTRETPNADPARKELNVIWGNQTVEATMGDWRRQLGSVDRKVRADAVTCLEYVFAYSPDALAGQKVGDYFASCAKWLEDRHGNERIIMGAVHYDETTPHMHVLVVPIREQVNKKGQKVKALNAKYWLDGSKKLSEMQTEFANAAGRPHGLERGVKGSRARHEAIKRFYGDLEAPHIAIQGIPEKGLLESPEKYSGRVETFVNHTVGKKVANLRLKAQLAQQASAERDSAKKTAEMINEDRQKMQARLAKLEAYQTRVDQWIRTATPKEFEDNQKFIKHKEEQEQKGNSR